MGWDDFLVRKKALQDDLGTAPIALHDGSTLHSSKAVEWIYVVLSVLDSKASALMRLSGVLIAAAAFMLGQLGSPSNLLLSRDAMHAKLVAVAALLSAVSITLCLLVVNVSWSFLGKTESSGGKLTFDAEVRALAEAMSFRQRAYQYAWRVSLIASGLFIFELVTQVAHIFFR